VTLTTDNAEASSVLLNHGWPPESAKNGADSQCMVIRWLFRGVAIVLGFAQIVAARNTFSPDARSYMELARAILRHDWAMTINAYWSALYPWLLAGVIGIVKPSLRWEFPVAHALAFPLWLACIAAFEFFWTNLLHTREFALAKCSSTGTPLSSLQMWALGYSLLIWLAVGGLIPEITPDLCVAATVLLSAGLLIRIAMAGGGRRSLYIWFGICLGIGYLVKAILFPMAFVFLGTMVAVSGRAFRAAQKGIWIAFLIFLMIAAPQITALSLSKGRITFSDTGKLAFAWYTYNLPLRNWQGEPAGSGTPAHPTRRLYERPAVYEFDGPLRSSYPPWYDPSYWNEGLSPAFQLRLVARHALHDVVRLGSVLIHPIAWFAGIVLILIGSDLRGTLRGIAVCWYLVAISAIVAGLYCLTLVEGRYLAPWELLIWGGILAGIRLRRTMVSISGLLTAAMSFALIASTAYLVYGESVHGFHNDASVEYRTAEGLRHMGLQPGEKVGAIGFDNDAHWAYLARLNIVAEIDSDDTCLFWSEPSAVQAQILEKFAQAGARVVVANTGGAIRSTSMTVPIDLRGCARPDQGWRTIDGSPNHAFFLFPTAQAVTH
jgi:hypothetical protein